MFASIYLYINMNSRNEILPSLSSSTSAIMPFRPMCVCGAPNFSIIIFISVKSRYPSHPTSYLQKLEWKVFFSSIEFIQLIEMIHAQIEKCGFLIKQHSSTTRHDRDESKKQNNDMLLLSVTSLGQHSNEIRVLIVFVFIYRCCHVIIKCSELSSALMIRFSFLGNRECVM